jgi:hypothetical protein
MNRTMIPISAPELNLGENRVLFVEDDPTLVD